MQCTNPEVLGPRSDESRRKILSAQVLPVYSNKVILRLRIEFCGKSPLWFSVLLIMLWLPQWGVAQQISAPLPTDIPAAIAFSDWREVSHTESATEYAVTFPSPLPSGIPNNDVVPLRIFLPDEVKQPVPVVLLTHYWGATDLKAEVSLAGDLSRRGIATAILTLPYHLARTPPGHRSGDMAIEPDPVKLTRTMLQSVQDARRAVDFLASRPEFRKDEVGLAGTSLGALVAALTYAVEPRITHVAFLVGGADIAHIIWNSSRVVIQRDALRRRGFTEAKLAPELQTIEPLTYLPRSTPGTAFVIGAKYDTVIPAESTSTLIEALPGARTLWLDTGHYGGVFVQRKLLNEVAVFFAQEFAGRTYTPPKRVVAPTIRLGLKLDAPYGPDLIVGLDLLKFDVRGDAFASFFVSPRGPQLFIGTKVSQSVSLGIIGSVRGAGVGLLWSTVL